MELERLRIFMISTNKNRQGISTPWTNTRQLTMTKGSQESTEMVDTKSKAYVKRWFGDAARFCCCKVMFLILHILMLHTQTMNRKLKGNDIQDKVAALSDLYSQKRTGIIETRRASDQTVKITMPYVRIDSVLCLSGQKTA